MDVVNISSKTASNLGELVALGDEQVNLFCRYLLQSVVTGSSNVPIDDSMQPQLQALCTLILEAARVRASVDAVRAILKEQGIGGKVGDTILGTYEQHLQTLIDHMEATGIAAPTIVGIEWRLDYAVRSKHGGRVNVPQFIISLSVKDRGVIRDIEMLATQEELQDLLAKVKDATKQVERVLHTQES